MGGGVEDGPDAATGTGGGETHLELVVKLVGLLALEAGGDGRLEKGAWCDVAEVPGDVQRFVVAVQNDDVSALILCHAAHLAEERDDRNLVITTVENVAHLNHLR